MTDQELLTAYESFKYNDVLVLNIKPYTAVTLDELLRMVKLLDAHT